MTKLTLSIATGDYDRTRALIDGAVAIDGVHPIFMPLSPEEMFFRAFRDRAFDVSELSLSSFALATAAGTNPYIGIPVFPSRASRRTAICIRTDRNIERPGDLRGRRIGTPEYQLTACVWARSLLEEEFDVASSDVTWVRGGLEQANRSEKIALAFADEILRSTRNLLGDDFWPYGVEDNRHILDHFYPSIMHRDCRNGAWLSKIPSTR